VNASTIALVQPIRNSDSGIAASVTALALSLKVVESPGQNGRLGISASVTALALSLRVVASPGQNGL